MTNPTKKVVKPSRRSRSGLSTRDDDLAPISPRVRSILSECFNTIELERKVAQERCRRVDIWLRENRSEFAVGSLLPNPTRYENGVFGLAEFEGYGRHGNAVQVKLDGLSEIGQLWWCDPEGKTPLVHRFAFYTKIKSRDYAFELLYAT